MFNVSVALLLYDALKPATPLTNGANDKKLSYCWETVRRESMPRIAEINVEMTA